MPIVKKNEAMPERAIIMVLYGTPGCGKTSVSTTSKNPLVIDCDRGSDRAVQRVDTLVASRWEDIASEMESFKDYKTIIIDTAKAMLDDFLSDFAARSDYKLAKNALKRFGKMGEDFKFFVSQLRNNGTDIIFICHDKETVDGDIIKHSPDCTGQSKDLLLRIADQVGYVSMVNGKRTISFDPMDNYIGKNVGQIPMIAIPDVSDKEFGTFMDGLVAKVKNSIHGRSEAQQAAIEKLQSMRLLLEKAETQEEIKDLMSATKELPKMMQSPFFKEMCDSLGKKGYKFDASQKTFVTVA